MKKAPSRVLRTEGAQNPVLTHGYAHPQIHTE